MSNSPGWLRNILGAIPAVSQSGGGKLQPEPFASLNVIGGTVAKNASTGNVDLTIPTGVGVVPNSVVGLSSLVATASRQFQSVDYYQNPGDGGGGMFVWDDTDTRASNGGTIIAVSGVPTGRWNRVNPAPDVFNVRHFGVVGDGTTDDTAKIDAVVLLWEAAAASGLGPELYFPTGTYKRTTALVAKNIRGAVIRGDGRHQSVIKLSGAYADAPSVIQRQNCQYVVIRDLGVSSDSQTTTISGTNAAGVTTMSIASANHIATGMIVTLDHIDSLGPGAWREILTVLSAGAGSVTFTTPTQYPYVANDVLCFAPQAGILDYSDVTDPGLLFASHGNKCVGISAGSDSAYALQHAFATACKGGTGSSSDINNDLHVYDHCTSVNPVWSGYFVGHANSLQNTLIACEMSGYVPLYAPTGGSYAVKGGSYNPIAWLQWIGGTASYAQQIEGALCEASRNSGFLYATGITSQRVRCSRLTDTAAQLQTTVTTTTVNTGDDHFNVASTNGLRPGQKVILATSTFSHQETATVKNVAVSTSAPSGYTVTLTAGVSNAYASGDYFGVAYAIDVSGTSSRIVISDTAIGPGAANTPGQLLHVVDTSGFLRSSLVLKSCELCAVGYDLDGCVITVDAETRFTNSGSGARVETFANGAVAHVLGGSPVTSQYSFGTMSLPDVASDPVKPTVGGIVYSKLGQPYWEDSTGTVTALIVPNVWRPVNASGLVLMLESDVGIVESTGVTNWYDQSGQRNDAVASGTGKPSIQTNIINGLQIVRFNGSTNFMTVADSRSLNFGTGSFDVFAVIVPRAVGAFQCILGKSSQADAANLRFMVTSGNQVDTFWGNDGQAYTPIGATTASGTAALLEWGVDATNAKQRTAVGATVSTGSVTVSGTGSNTSALYIGSDIAGAYFAQYDIAAVYAYKANYLSSTDRANLVAYIKNKYGAVA